MEFLVLSKPRSKLYIAWANMTQRCLDPNATHFNNYGGRGIKVCERWRCFELFKEDMGEPPTGTTLDRINNDLGYEPENCRWATPKEQAQNRRSSRMIEHEGKRLPIIEWSRITGLDHRTIGYRLKCGWSVEDALTRPKISNSEAGKMGAVGRWNSV